MLTAEAVIRTEHPSRYLARLRGHSAKMGRHSGHWKLRHTAGHVPPEKYLARISIADHTASPWPNPFMATATSLIELAEVSSGWGVGVVQTPPVK